MIEMEWNNLYQDVPFYTVDRNSFQNTMFELLFVSEQVIIAGDSLSS